MSRDDTKSMLTDEFFSALLDYTRRESQLLHYARQRAARGALRRLDWDLLSDAREDNARRLHDTYVKHAPSDRS